MQTATKGRPAGSRQLKPTQAERREYWQRLRSKADAGDVQAIAAVLNLCEGKA